MQKSVQFNYTASCYPQGLNSHHKVSLKKKTALKGYFNSEKFSRHDPNLTRPDNQNLSGLITLKVLPSDISVNRGRKTCEQMPRVELDMLHTILTLTSRPLVMIREPDKHATVKNGYFEFSSKRSFS